MQQSAQNGSFIYGHSVPAPIILNGSAIAYTLLALPMGIIYFTFIVTGLSLSAGLMPIFIGFPLLLAVLIAVRAILNFERSMAFWLLGEQNRHPAEARNAAVGTSFFGKLTARLTDIRTYKGIIFMLLKLPIGILNFTVTVTFICLSIGFIVSPVAYVAVKETLDINIFDHNMLHYFFNFNITPIQESLICCVIGIFMGFVALKVIRIMAELTARITLLASE